MKTIGILPDTPSGLKRTLDAVGEVFNVRCVERAYGNDAGIDAWFVHAADQAILSPLSRVGLPIYAVIDDAHLVACGATANIDFARHGVIPAVLGGRRITTDDAVAVKALPTWLKNITVLASKEGAPVWAVREELGHPCHYISLPVSTLKEGEPLYQYFSGSRFLHLLPLIIFMRTLNEDTLWEQPPLQACFMFDDPNLHWRTYGYIDFASLAAHAQINRYHTCFAMIPQDAWFVHKPTAALFRTHKDKLSLVIHGNDHIAGELAVQCSDAEKMSNMLQALGRIRSFEKKSGVAVAKVMVPPHGACNERYLAAMALTGFEAACISSGSLRHHNPAAPWLSTVGLRPADIISGLTVLPRFPFFGHCHNRILVSAILNQPIVVRGHHADVAGGLQMLADVAEFINALGIVSWSNMQRISRSTFAQRLDGQCLKVRMYSKRIDIVVPEGISRLYIERPWLDSGDLEPLMMKRPADGTEWSPLNPDESIAVTAGHKIAIQSRPVLLSNTDIIRNIRFWPVVRRQLTEARDRLTPLLRRFSS